jgi:hypothetical protein
MPDRNCPPLAGRGVGRITHHVVLMANRALSPGDLDYYLFKAVRRAHERVLRRSAYRGVPTQALWAFEANFERTTCGIPHFHLAMRIDPSISVQITDAMKTEWEHRFPVPGAFFERSVESEDPSAAIAYIVKKFSFCCEAREAYTTSWHLLPPWCKKPEESRI